MSINPFNEKQARALQEAADIFTELVNRGAFVSGDGHRIRYVLGQLQEVGVVQSSTKIVKSDDLKMAIEAQNFLYTMPSLTGRDVDNFLKVREWLRDLTARLDHLPGDTTVRQYDFRGTPKENSDPVSFSG